MEPHFAPAISIWKMPLCSSWYRWFGNSPDPISTVTAILPIYGVADMADMAAMAAMADLTVYNIPSSPPKWDQVGVFYISFCVTWTILLLAGMVFCLINRHHPILRVRGLPLSFSAIVLLHIYWILGQITYPIGGSVHMVLAYDIQYFAMSVYFPLGIALFHASNLRFLHVAKMQKQFADPELRNGSGNNGTSSSWLYRLKNMRYTTRVSIYIGIGMVFQFALAVGMWFACKKYHPTYGVPGTGIEGMPLPKQIIELGRGWEWWPSVVWQFIWAWIVAPILIWRAWGIRDTMGWRAQTIACCICSLHAAPMFLIASYVPAFQKVNAYFTPSQWIHLSTTMYEIFTVFVPIFEIAKMWILNKKAADSSARCISDTPSIRVRTPGSGEWKNTSSSTLAEKGQTSVYLGECTSGRMFAMDALEHALATSPEPLQDFAAYNDFSGENIAFLTSTTSWKSSWSEKPDQEDEVRGAYNHALWIYTTFISPRDAEFPLNISSQALKQLQTVFEKPARILCGEGSVNPATPFEGENNSTLSSQAVGFQVQYTGEIPDGFNMAVFNRVQDHVKHLVLTNTWPKFIESMRRRSSDSLDSNFTTNSDSSLTSWLSSQRAKILSFL